MSEKPKVWLNNRIVAWEDVTVPVLSHGHSRGSAIFEVFGTHIVPGGVAAFRMNQHLKRMEATLSLLEMKVRFSSDQIARAVAEIVALNTMQRGLVKIIGYWSHEEIINLVLRDPLDLAIFTIVDSPELGLDNETPITACLSKWRKADPGAVPVEAKACANYLSGYLVRKDAQDRGFDLGLTLQANGMVAEGSVESVFIVKDGILKTPPLGNILASVSRNSIIAVSKANGIEIEEAGLTAEDLYDADEMFACHTGIKVIPIAKFEDRDLPAPGLITARLAGIMRDILATGDSGFAEWFQMLYPLQPDLP